MYTKQAEIENAVY